MQTPTAAFRRAASDATGDYTLSVGLLGAVAGFLLGALVSGAAPQVAPPAPIRCVQMEPLAVEVP